MTKKKARATKTRRHWTKYVLPFGPCQSGLEAGQKTKTIEEFWNTCEEGAWLFWLWLVVAFRCKEYCEDLTWVSRKDQLRRGGCRCASCMRPVVYNHERNVSPAEWVRSSQYINPSMIRRLFKPPPLEELKKACHRAQAWERRNRLLRA